MIFPTLYSISQTTFRLIVSAIFFLTIECVLDCSGLDQFADYYEFLEHQQHSMIHENTEKEMTKAIGKLFINSHCLQIQLT
jgi:hypothetical protein